MAKASTFDVADYLDNPEIIAEYLSEAFLTADQGLIADAIGNVARAKGMSGIAQNTGLSREGLYKSFSVDGNPELSTTVKVLDSLDMELVVRPKTAA